MRGGFSLPGVFPRTGAVKYSIDPAACSSCSAKLRTSGVGLKSYLLSGKSSAMAINFRPISFHCAKTICELLGMAFEASLFCCACRANDGHPHNPATSKNKKVVFIIFVMHILRFSANISPGRWALDPHLTPETAVGPVTSQTKAAC